MQKNYKEIMNIIIINSRATTEGKGENYRKSVTELNIKK